MGTDSIECAFFKIPKANDISELKSVFIALQVHYSVMHCKSL